MPVVWRDQLSVGNNLIDNDHKYLLCLFNSIELALSKLESLKHLPTFTRQLLDYTQEHFLREEQLQIKVQYPHYQEHKLHHQQIVERLTAMHEQLVIDLAKAGMVEDGADATGAKRPQAELEALRQRLEREVLGLARDWIIDHVIKMDKPMQPYLKGCPAYYQ